MKIIKIGLVGEAPHDTLSMENLLSKRYPDDRFEFISMLDRITGSQLDSQRTKRFLRVEYETKKPDFVIFIRDLDANLPNKLKQDEKKEYFRDFNSVVDKKGIMLLHIWEIEALIFTDVENFNTIYDCDLMPVKDVMLIPDPKRVLKQISRKYKETDNSSIFTSIDFTKTLECRYFSDFIARFDLMLTK